MNDDAWMIIAFVLACILVFQFFIYRRNRKSFGQIVVTQDIDGKKLFSLEIDKDPDEIASMDLITFKVTHQENEDYEDLAD